MEIGSTTWYLLILAAGIATGLLIGWFRQINQNQPFVLRKEA